MISRALRQPTLRQSIGTRGFSSAQALLQETKKPDQDISQFNYDQEHQQSPKDLVSGAPRDLAINRVVRIYQQAKPATQSGTWGTHAWRIDWDVVNRTNRWENDLMGWPSSGDYMQGTQMKFRTKDDAMRFAANQGWDFYVQEPHKRQFRVKQYATNFQHSPGKLKHIRTK